MIFFPSLRFYKSYWNQTQLYKKPNFCAQMVENICMYGCWVGDRDSKRRRLIGVLWDSSGEIGGKRGGIARSKSNFFIFGKGVESRQVLTCICCGDRSWRVFVAGTSRASSYKNIIKLFNINKRVYPWWAVIFRPEEKRTVHKKS